VAPKALRPGDLESSDRPLMKILQLVTRRQHRGAEVFAAQLSDGLVQEGHEVLLVGLHEQPWDPLEPLLAPTVDLFGGPERALSYGLVSQLVDLIREFRPDVVQANGSSTLKYSSIARVVSRGRWPLVYRNISIASQWVRGPAHRLFGQWLVRNVTHVAAVSRLSAEDFRVTYRVPSARISTIPIGVHVPSTPRVPGLRERLMALAGIGEAPELLLHVGSFSPEKNHVWMVDAFARVLQQRPQAHLLLVGDGPLRSRVESHVADRGLQQRIHLLGTRGDVPTIVGGADLLVLPSTIEGIPGVILEAAAQAVPTVATDVGSIGEVIDSGRSGVLVPAGAMPEFVEAVVALLADPRKRQMVGDAAYRVVQERYSMDRIVVGFVRLYQQLLHRRPQNEEPAEVSRAWT
jgi:glycosyltransferase involved in cell wall biosynthesis